MQVVSMKNILKTGVVTFLLMFLVLVSNNAMANSHRVVAIDGSITEIIYALGKEQSLVGRDVTSLYPKDAEKLPSVGYMRSLSAEGILSLKPTLVLATSDAKPQSVLKRLKDAGVHIQIVPNAYSIEGVKQKILTVARALNDEPAGEKLANQFQQKADSAIALAKERAAQQGERKALFLLNARGNQLLVAGTQTRADEVLQLAAIQNPAAKDMQGYKPLTAEGAIQYNPNYIIALQTQMTEQHLEAILEQPALKMTSAAKEKHFMVLAGDDLSFGPRLPEVIRKLSDKVYGQTDTNRTED
jgi:iron complex transport system substrate-binding protein